MPANADTKAVTPTTKAPMPVAMIAALVSLRPLINDRTPVAAFLKPDTAPPVNLSSPAVTLSRVPPRSLVALVVPSIAFFALSAPVTFRPTSITSAMLFCF